MRKRAPVFVARPSLPPLADILPLLEEIWDSRMLSNYGPLVRRFEAALCKYLGVEHLSLVANASLGIVLALRQAGATSGEVITTPFSFVATGHAIQWAGAMPVFADIDPTTLNLDPEQAERQITPQTRAIMPVHTFGTPCDVAAFTDISKRHNIPVIYDAAHAFAINDDAGSILNHGDMSVLSFHATKVFHTFEGGAVISSDRDTKEAIDRMCNFGFVNETAIDAIGLNAKMSELHATIGLAQLPTIDAAIAARGAVSDRYLTHFKDVVGVNCVCGSKRPGHNHYAFPIRITEDHFEDRDALYARLKANEIFARRYFYPLISDFEQYSHLASADPALLPIATKAASEILCLPIYNELTPEVQMDIISVVRGQCG